MPSSDCQFLFIYCIVIRIRRRRQSSSAPCCARSAARAAGGGRTSATSLDLHLWTICPNETACTRRSGPDERYGTPADAAPAPLRPRAGPALAWSKRGRTYDMDFLPELETRERRVGHLNHLKLENNVWVTRNSRKPLVHDFSHECTILATNA